jgi:hypothetical protein
MITFKSVTKSDFSFLYELLKTRRPVENISHKKMPTFREHEKFCKSSPYQFWEIIYDGVIKIGSAYISKLDEVAIHLLPKFQKKKSYIEILKLLIKKHPKSRYLANVNSKNMKLMNLYKENGFKLIQYTFEFQNN